MKPTDVYCMCEKRKFTEIMQGLIIDEDLLLLIGDTGLAVWTYKEEEGRIVVDCEDDYSILSLDMNTFNLPQNLEAVRLAKMSFPEFIQYLVEWDGGEVVAGVNPGDHIYEAKERFIWQVAHVYRNGTVSTIDGKLIAAGDYVVLQEKDVMALAQVRESIIGGIEK